MPANPERFTYRHLRLPREFTETERYKSAPGRGPTFKPYARDRVEHRALLAGQLDRIQHELETIDERREAIGISGYEGITVIFRSEPDYELKHQRLDLPSKGIELLMMFNCTLRLPTVSELQLLFNTNTVRAGIFC